MIRRRLSASAIGSLAAFALLSTASVARADEVAPQPQAAPFPLPPLESAPQPQAAPAPAPATAQVAPSQAAPASALDATAPVALAPTPAQAAPVVAPVLASSEPTEPDHESPTRASAPLAPRRVDARAMLRTTPALEYGGVGLGADVGLVRAGPGTLSAGGGLSYDACGTSCTTIPHDVTQQYLSAEGRIAYHVAPPKIGYVDLYPMLTVGLVFSRATLRPGDGSEYRGSDVAPSVGFGGGASYFFHDSFFVSGEARLRFAGGNYGYELASGPARPFDLASAQAWNVSSLDLGVGVGARF